MEGAKTDQTKAKVPRKKTILDKLKEPKRKITFSELYDLTSFCFFLLMNDLDQLYLLHYFATNYSLLNDTF